MGHDLAAAMDEALANPESYAPKFERPPPAKPGVGPIVEILKVLLKQTADDHSVAARLIATVSDLEAIASDDEADVQALKGWRREVFGERALALKQGRLALLIKGKRLVAIDVTHERSLDDPVLVPVTWRREGPGGRPGYVRFALPRVGEAAPLEPVDFTEALTGK